MTISPGGAERLSGESAHRRPVQRGRAKEQGGVELNRKSILVLPVHTFLTTGANADFPLDYNYSTWKYAAVLATTGGAFDSVTISPNVCVPCASNPCTYACTSWGPLSGYTVVFGSSAFTGTENQAASIIGHELVHTAVGLMAGECPAYEWERDHSQQTGVWFCDVAYLEIMLQRLNCACAGGKGCP